MPELIEIMQERSRIEGAERAEEAEEVPLSRILRPVQHLFRKPKRE